MTNLIDRRCPFPPLTTRLSPTTVGVLSALALAGVCLLAAPAVRAQVLHAAAIPNEFKTSANTLTAGQITLIGKFVDGEIANLNSGKPENEKAGRKALEDAAVSAGDTAASAPYLAGYASVLNTKLTQLAKTQPPLQVRLNAAIVVAHVAARANNAMLKDAATVFTLDGAEPVALWGVKAGKYLLPFLLEVRQSGALAAAIVKAVDTFKTNGAIVEDAYDDFTGGNPPAPPTRGPPAIDPLINLMEQRARLYQAAANVQPGADPVLPADPAADKSGYSFIGLPAVWKSANLGEQQKMCRAGIDLLGQIIPLVDVTPARAAGVDPPELLRREDLIAVINQAGSAFVTVGLLKGEPEYFPERGETPKGDIGKAAYMLTTAKVSVLTPGPVLTDRLNALEGVLKAANLMAPPFPPPPPAAPVRPAAVPAAPATLPPVRPPAGPPTASGARPAH